MDARPATVEPESKLVEVVIQMCTAHRPLMGSQKPALEKRRHSMHARQKCDCILRSPPNDNQLVPIALHLSVGVQAIRPNNAVGLDCIADEPVQLFSRSSRNATQSDASYGGTVFLRGDDHQGLALGTATTVALLQTADECFVDFDPACKSVSIRANHRSTQFVQPSPCRLVTPKTHDTLNSKSTRSIFLTSHPPHRTKPKCQRLANVLKYRSRRNRRLKLTVTADQKAAGVQPSFACHAARTNKALRPAQFYQILSTCRLRRKTSLKFWERGGKVFFHAPKYYG